MTPGPDRGDRPERGDWGDRGQRDGRGGPSGRSEFDSFFETGFETGLESGYRPAVDETHPRGVQLASPPPAPPGWPGPAVPAGPGPTSFAAPASGPATDPTTGHPWPAPPGAQPETRRTGRMWARGSTPTTQVAVLAARSLRGLREPRAVVVGLLQPLVMLLLFSQVFSKLAQGPGFTGGGTSGYLGYLMPAVLVTTAAGSALGSGGWLVFERNSGVFTRLRAMPIRISSVLIARSISDLVRTALQLLVMIALAMVILHYRPAGGPLSLAAAWGLSMIAGCGFSWLFLAISCWVKNVEVMQAIGFLVMFPLTFTSSAYVPVTALPRTLQYVARFNPITYAVDGARSVTSSTPSSQLILKALVVSLAFTAAGMTLAIKGFRRSL